MPSHSIWQRASCTSQKKSDSCVVLGWHKLHRCSNTLLFRARFLRSLPFFVPTYSYADSDTVLSSEGNYIHQRRRNLSGRPIAVQCQTENFTQASPNSSAGGYYERDSFSFCVFNPKIMVQGNARGTIKIRYLSFYTLGIYSNSVR